MWLEFLLDSERNARKISFALGTLSTLAISTNYQWSTYTSSEKSNVYSTSEKNVHCAYIELHVSGYIIWIPDYFRKTNSISVDTQHIHCILKFYCHISTEDTAPIAYEA